MNCPICRYDGLSSSMKSCPNCGVKLKTHKSLTKINITQNIEKAEGQVQSVYIEKVNGDLFLLVPHPGTYLELKSRIERHDNKMKLILNFKNNTSNPIQIDGYRIEVTKGDKPRHTTGFKNGVPVFHTYGRIIDPSKDWQEKAFDLFDPMDWKINEKGEYQFKTAVIYEINGKYEYKSYSFISNY